jgi:hypothetical protein
VLSTTGLNVSLSQFLPSWTTRRALYMPLFLILKSYLLDNNFSQ